jgi:hypothetical protein
MWFTILVITLAAAICLSVAAVVMENDRVVGRFGR